MAEGFATWYSELTSRERLLLIVCAFVLSVGGIYRLAWMPLQADRELQSARIVRLDRALAAVQTLPKGGALAQSPTTGSISAILGETAGKQGFVLKKVEVQPDGSATVSLDAVPFDQLILWLDGLNRTHGITIGDVSIGKTEAPGRVTVAVALKGSGE